MANFTVIDSLGATQEFKETGAGTGGSPFVPHVNVDTLVAGTAATSLGKAEDAAHGSGDTGVMVLAVRQDTAAALAGTDSDYAPLEVDANGRLHVILSSAEKAEDAAHTSGDKGLMSLAVRNDAGTALAGADGDYIPLGTDATGNLRTVATAAGDTAHDAADAGNPVKIGGKASTSAPAAVTANDRVNAWMTLQGLVNVISPAAAVDVNAAVAADVEPAVAAAAGLRLVGFSCRESDGTPAVASFRIIHGATVGGGTAVFVVELAANESKTVWCWPGIDCASGISIDREAGTFDLHLFTVTVV